MTDRTRDPAVKPRTREPSLKEIGIEARKIDPDAFAANISRWAPDMQKWRARRVAALAQARERLESYPVDKTGV